MQIPAKLRWLFWEIDARRIDLERDADYVIAHIVEHGAPSGVQWAMRHYGLARIHRFFREVGHPELSARTIGLWRAFFRASKEVWAEPPSFRKTSAVRWPG